MKCLWRFVLVALTAVCFLVATGCEEKKEDTSDKSGAEKIEDKGKKVTKDEGKKVTKDEGKKVTKDEGKKAAEKKPVASIKLIKVDLTEMLAKAGRTATTKVVVMAPEGATVSESYGDVEVEAGKGFKLVVVSEAHDVAKDKAFQLKNTVQKHKRFLIDTPEAIIGESSMMSRTSFFLTANQKVGEETFGCKSKRGAVSFTETEIKAMLDACKSLKVAP